MSPQAITSPIQPVLKEFSATIAHALEQSCNEGLEEINKTHSKSTPKKQTIPATNTPPPPKRSKRTVISKTNFILTIDEKQC
jgi:hypothetical protein